VHPLASADVLDVFVELAAEFSARIAGWGKEERGAGFFGALRSGGDLDGERHSGGNRCRCVGALCDALRQKDPLVSAHELGRPRARAIARRADSNSSADAREKFRLKFDWKVADFVKEERCRGLSSSAADFLTDGAGEGRRARGRIARIREDRWNGGAINFNKVLSRRD